VISSYINYNRVEMTDKRTANHRLLR
jgi:hypothetical protein